jgi:hypothetical protein
LVNALSNAIYLGIDKAQILKALELMGKNPMIRGEALTTEEFGALSNYLSI